MEIVSSSSDLYFRKTRFALFFVSLLSEPFLALFSLLPFILRKDLAATLLQISIFMALKPMMALLSFYWSGRIAKKRHRLRLNFALASFFSFLPFFFFPFFDNVWILMFLSLIYMLFFRAGMPAWMEILKINVPKKTRERLFSIASAIGYGGGVVIGLFLGSFLDHHPQAFKFLFLLGALLGLVAVVLQIRLPIRPEEGEVLEEKEEKSLGWKESWQLLKSRKDFAHFQWGFMLGGLGIMLVLPAANIFYTDFLHLSHREIAIGRYIFIGFGYVFSSSFWAKALSRFSLFSSTALICLGFGLFPLLLFFASWNLTWIFLAFVAYGITQAGSHLLWHLSGPIFSGKEESSQFSRINVLTVGLRGLIGPLMGGWWCNCFGPLFVLIFGAFICFAGSGWMLRQGKKLEVPSFEKG